MRSSQLESDSNLLRSDVYTKMLFPIQLNEFSNFFSFWRIPVDVRMCSRPLSAYLRLAPCGSFMRTIVDPYRGENQIVGSRGSCTELLLSVPRTDEARSMDPLAIAISPLPVAITSVGSSRRRMKWSIKPFCHPFLL